MRRLDAHKMADEAQFRGFHALILFWCAIIIIFDGYDLAVAGIALPSIMKDMGVDPTQAGFMVSSALFGMMFGAIFLGTVADHIGRRWAIVACITLFSLFTAAAGLTKDPILFSITRFLAGLGIGGVMPNVVAHMTEYAPRKMRSTLVTLMFSGYAVGGMVAALLGKGLIEAYGWQSVFLAAAAPIVLIPFILSTLPESMPFLLDAGRHEELKRIIAKLDPNYHPVATDHFALPDEDRADHAPVHHLFHEGRGFSTVMFWIAFLICLFMVYALSSWLTKLMAAAGYNLGSALSMVLALNFGGMVGAIAGGWFADRFHIKWVLVSMFVLAGVSISALGINLPQGPLMVVVAFAGASTIGTQIVAYAYAGQFYPMAVRSTGIGFASGVGRSGAILAPILIGMLVAMHMPLQMNFLAIAIPGLVAALAVSLIDHSLSASTHRQDVSGEEPDPTPAASGRAAT